MHPDIGTGTGGAGGRGGARKDGLEKKLTAVAFEGVGDRKQRHNRITFQDGRLVAKHRSVFSWGTKVVCVEGEEEGAPRIRLDQEGTKCPR